MNFALILVVTVVFASLASQLVRVQVSYGRRVLPRRNPAVFELRFGRTWVVNIHFGRGGGYIWGRTVQLCWYAKGGDSAHLYTARKGLFLTRGNWYPADSEWKTWNLASQTSHAVPQHGAVGCLRSWAANYLHVG